MPFLSLPILAYSAYYDATAALILLLIIACAFLRHLNKSKSSKIFLIMILICFIASGIDIVLNVISKGYKQYNIQNIDPNFALTYSIGTTYGFIRYSIPFVFTIYVMAFTKSLKRMSKAPLYLALTIIPFVVLEILVLTNPFTKIMFDLSLNASGDIVITHSNFKYILTFIELYYFFFVGLNLYNNRKIILKVQFYSLFAFIPINLIAIIIRVINGGVVIDMLFYSLSFLLIVQNVESPELLIDPRTNLSSSKQFDIAIKTAYMFKENIYVLLIFITNYTNIFNKFSYIQADKYLKLLSRKLELIDKNKDVYSLDGGLFAVIFDTKEEIQKASNIYFKQLSTVNFDELDFEPEMSISIIDALNDFSTEKLLNSYIDNYMYIKNQGIMEFSKTKNDYEKMIELNIDSILENAINFGHLKVHYQPVYNSIDKKFSFAEALVRIDSPEYGLILPEYFIPYAESRGFIKDIDLLVIEEVMKFISTNNLKKLGINAISTNLSILDLSSKEFIESIIKLKEKYHIDPNFIKFEITETNGVSFDTNIYDSLETLNDCGFEFVLDDYGTGYSNLERFAKLPIKYVKLDRGLVRLANVDKMADVLKTTIDMIHELDRKTFIEGIESESDYHKFIDYNCVYIQGTYFSAALPKDEFIDFITNKNLLIN